MFFGLFLFISDNWQCFIYCINQGFIITCKNKVARYTLGFPIFIRGLDYILSKTRLWYFDLRDFHPAWISQAPTPIAAYFKTSA